MTRDPFTRPLGTAPGEAFHVSNAIHDTRATQRARPDWEGIAAVIFACVAVWGFVAYLFWWHV